MNAFPPEKPIDRDLTMYQLPHAEAKERVQGQVQAPTSTRAKPPPTISTSQPSKYSVLQHVQQQKYNPFNVKSTTATHRQMSTSQEFLHSSNPSLPGPMDKPPANPVMVHDSLPIKMSTRCTGSLNSQSSTKKVPLKQKLSLSCQKERGRGRVENHKNMEGNEIGSFSKAPTLGITSDTSDVTAKEKEITPQQPAYTRKKKSETSIAAEKKPIPMDISKEKKNNKPSHVIFQKSSKGKMTALHYPQLGPPDGNGSVDSNLTLDDEDFLNELISDMDLPNMTTTPPVEPGVLATATLTSATSVQPLVSRQPKYKSVDLVLDDVVELPKIGKKKSKSKESVSVSPGRDNEYNEDKDVQQYLNDLTWDLVSLSSGTEEINEGTKNVVIGQDKIAASTSISTSNYDGNRDCNKRMESPNILYSELHQTLGPKQKQQRSPLSLFDSLEGRGSTSKSQSTAGVCSPFNKEQHRHKDREEKAQADALLVQETLNGLDIDMFFEDDDDMQDNANVNPINAVNPSHPVKNPIAVPHSRPEALHVLDARRIVGAECPVTVPFPGAKPIINSEKVKCRSGTVQGEEGLEKEVAANYSRYLVFECTHGSFVPVKPRFSGMEGQPQKEIKIRLFDEVAGAERFVILRGGWTDTRIAPGDTVHIIGQFDEQTKTCVIDDDQ
eukprot:Ihof_evm22s29 gene=Ihof_evmTU22s29